ncbi:MAG: GspH/FimT family pseudopilin [Candidatus Binatia bacterium]
MRTSTATSSSPAPRRRAGAGTLGLTLLETLLALAVVALAARIVLPRVAAPSGVAVDVAARRLADTLTLARERAVLGGRPGRVRLDLDAGRWTDGDMATVLPAGLRLRAVDTGADRDARTGTVDVAFDPAGDARPVTVDLADERGRTARVVLATGAGRARVVNAAGPP